MIENLLVAQHTGSTAIYWPGSSIPVGRQAESQALDRAFYWLEVVEMVDCANRLAGTLSYGQQRRLEIARACAPVRRCSVWTSRPPASTR